MLSSASKQRHEEIQGIGDNQYYSSCVGTGRETE